MPEGYDEPIRVLAKVGVRSWMLSTYAVGVDCMRRGDTPAHERKSHSAARQAREIGCWLWLGCGGDGRIRIGRGKRMKMDVEALAKKWHEVIVGLAVAHDKDLADRWEAMVDDCLQPILKAPVSQVRELAGKIRDRLKADPSVPYVVWHGLEAWVDKIVLLAPDEEVKELKTALAKEIVDMVEDDAKRDLPDAMVRALQWRSSEQLEKMRGAVSKAKQSGKPVALRGRESCLFLEVGPADDPEVCVQV
jgi:hypothetical protein